MSSNWPVRKRASLIKRLRGWLYDVRDDGEACVVVKLVQLDDQGKTIRGVTRWTAPFPGDVETLATQIADFVEEDAGGKGGERYALEPLFGAGMVPRDETAKLTSVGSSSTDDADLNTAPSEPADARGRQAQDMRHTENLARLYMSGTQNAIDSIKAENVSLRTRAEADDRRRIKFFEDLERVATELHKRKADDEDRAFMRENIRELRDVAKVIGPHLINSASGKKLLPEPDMEEVMLEQFFGDMICDCESDARAKPDCEWHALLAASSDKRRNMFLLMADKAITIRERRAGTYQGDRPKESNETADAAATQAVEVAAEGQEVH